MKIWRKMKSSPNLYRKGRFDQMWPALTITFHQKKRFQSHEKFFAQQLKKSIPLNLKIKALKSYFHSNELSSLKSLLLKNPNKGNFVIKTSLLKLKTSHSVTKYNSRDYSKRLRSLFNNRTFKSLSNYANDINFLLSNREQKRSIFNDALALRSRFLAPGVLRIRKLQWSYALKLKAMNRVRLLLGRISLKSLISFFQKSQKSSNSNKIWKFVGSLESVLPNLFLKMGFTSHILNSNQWVQHKKIAINGNFDSKKSTSVIPGDIISLNTLSRNEFTRFFGQELYSFYRVLWNFTSHRHSLIRYFYFRIKQKRNRIKRTQLRSQNWNKKSRI